MSCMGLVVRSIHGPGPIDSSVPVCGSAIAWSARLRSKTSRVGRLARDHSLVDSLTAEELLKPGYYSEGWTVRDLMAHLSAWLAEGGNQLEQIHAGTRREGELDVEAANLRFAELTEGIPFDDVYVQAMGFEVADARHVARPDRDPYFRGRLAGHGRRPTLRRASATTTVVGRGAG